jgi:hypothetical protein
MDTQHPALEQKLQQIEDLLQHMRTTLDGSSQSPEPKFLYSLRSLADFLGCSTTTAQKLKNSEKIPFQQFGRKVIFNTNEVLEALQGGKMNSKKERVPGRAPEKNNS